MAEYERTPEEWIRYLTPLLEVQAAAAQTYRNYYEGKHRIAYATERFRDIFGRFFPASADNWMQVIVDSPVERLSVQGFRIGGAEAGNDEAAWDTWTGNKLEVGSRMAHTEAVKTGDAFVLVNKTVDPVRLTIESPTESYVCRDPESGESLAGIKRFVAEDEYVYVVLYLPERYYRFKSQSQYKHQSSMPTYDQLEPDGDGPTATEGVPLIPLENNPDLIDGGTSDLEAVIPIQDRINKLCLDMDVDSEFHAAPQRWATGWDPPTDEQGNPLPNTQIQAATSRFLAFSDPDTKVGQLPGGNPTAFVEPIEMYVQHMAAISHTPPHYLLGRMVNISGDALTAAETGLVSKCHTKITDFSGGWRVAMGMAQNKDPDDIFVVWRDPESRTFGQLVDGVVKLRKELALPLEMGWEMIGLSPQQIERAKKLIGLPERDFRDLDRGMAERQNQEKMQEKMLARAQQAGPQLPNQGNGATPRPVTSGGRRDAT